MNGKLGTLGALLREAFATAANPDPAWAEIMAALPADPVLASAVHRISDGGDTDDPLVEELAARVVAAGEA